ncbi:MAG: phospholipase [Solirubrobacteraceae bacterium]|jgi:phospholipase C|nr:phospholipase [Solirubrobacteraceae bacterium]
MAGTDEADIKRLRALKHIVVVMMENRSFDHMLGYLRQEGMTNVDGLSGTEFNFDPNGKKIFVQAFDAADQKLQRHGEALQKRLDPDHSVAGVQTQLGPGYPKTPHPNGNGGFVKSFVESRNPKDKVTSDLWMVPMGYYTSKDVPVYDHLARQYCVCDRWFSSVPGDTWPNRLYAVTGREGPNAAQKSDLWRLITDLPPLTSFRSLPIFDEPAFTRRLKSGQWRWYSHDPGTLRLIDERYRQLDDPMRDNFAFFDRRKLSFLTQAAEALIVRGNSFLDDAVDNKLPQVSWIDPNFIDVSVLETQSNDDHPPSDIRAGQAFVFEVYNALMHSKDWKDTLLIIAYDEHGGFYDHVAPPKLAAGDGSTHKSYGLRVPALIVGPRVRRQVLHQPPPSENGEQPQFDHTSVIKTILLAFAKDPKAALAAMPPRVRRAPHLGSLLGPVRTDIDDPRNARDLMDAWRAEATQRRRAQLREDGRTGAVAPDGAGQPVVLTEFQTDVHNAVTAVKRIGLNP